MWRLTDPALALFRVAVGLMFFFHGVSSLFGVLGGHRGSGEAVGFAVWPNWWAAVIQLGCGALVLAGLWTRAAATLASGSMAYAYFVHHQAEALLPLNNGGEKAAMFCWAFLLIAALGPGTWAVDSLRSRRDEAPAGATPGN